LTILAVARWWWRRRNVVPSDRSSALEPQSSLEPEDDLKTS
jgi:hypothetical protein